VAHVSIGGDEVEKRDGRRFVVNGRCTARINQDKEFKIRDLSISGTCLECPLSLVPNATYDIELTLDSQEKLTAKGVVVRSFLKSFHRAEYNATPLYHTGIRFVQLNDRDKMNMEKFIGRFD
jgi:hypothetical protein